MTSLIKLKVLTGPLPFCACIFLACILAFDGLALQTTRDVPDLATTIDAQKGPAPSATKTATDLYGDPLPPGAIARLGTIRFRTVTRDWPLLTFSPGGQILASSVQAGKICLWDAATGKLIHRLATEHDANAAFIQNGKYPTKYYGKPNFTQDGKVLACGGLFWNVADGKQIKPSDAKGLVMHEDKTGQPITAAWLATSADRKLLAGARGLGTIFVKDIATGKETCSFEGHEHCLSGLAFSPGGCMMATTAEDGTMRLWESSSGKLLHTYALVQGPSLMLQDVAFSPDGRILAVPIAGGGILPRPGLQAISRLVIRRWDPWQGKELKTWITEEAAFFGSNLVFAPDGKALAFGAGDGAIGIWSLATSKEVRRIAEPFMHRTSSTAYSPDGKTLAAASDAGVVLWDVVSGKKAKELPKQFPAMVSVAFSPDGKTLAGGDQSRIHLWDLAHGKEIAVFGDHTNRVSSLSFSPDGTILASAGWDLGGVRLWDVAQRKLIHRLEGHDGSVTAISFSPDGKTLASAGVDTTVLIWDVSRFVEREAAVELTIAELESCWNDLGGDGPIPYRAVKAAGFLPPTSRSRLSGALETGNKGRGGTHRKAHCQSR